MMWRRHVFGLLVLTLSPGGCLEGSGTGGRPIIADFELRTEWALEPGRIETSTGWTVEIDEAYLAIGPMTFFELPPALALETGPSDDVSNRLYSWFISTAHAHPGDEHFNGGRVMGELYQQVAFDLMQGEHEVAAGLRGLAGEVRSFSVALDPPSQRTKGDVVQLRGHHAWVEGTAYRDDLSIAFEGGMTIEDTGMLRMVDGIATEMVFDRGGQVVVSVHIDTWFDEAHFDRLEAQPDDDRFTIADGDQVHAAWRLAMRSGAAYSARREEE